MAFSATTWSPESLVTHRARMVAALAALTDDATPATDDRYLLSLLFTVLAETIARLDADLSEVFAILDPRVATGAALEIAAAVRGIRPRLAVAARVRGAITGTPAQVLVVGTLFRSTVDSTLWTLVAEVTLNVVGQATADIEAVEAGASTTGLLGGWISATAGVTATFVAGTALRAGADRESEASLRARLLAVETSGKGSQAAAEAAVRALGYDAWERSNRSNVVDSDGIPPHHIHVVVGDGGTDYEIAEAILYSASEIAGFYGAVLVEVANPQNPDDPALPSVEVRFSRLADLQGYVLAVVMITGAQVPPPSNLTTLVADAIAQWSSHLASGVQPTETALAPVIFAAIPAGCVVKMDVSFSLDGILPYSHTVPVLFGQRFRARNAPSPAVILGSGGPAILTIAAWNLDLSVDGGPLQQVLCTGIETTVADFVVTFNGAGITGAVASVSTAGTLILTTLSVGAASNISVLGTSAAGLLATLGLVPITGVGRDTDITVNLV